MIIYVLMYCSDTRANMLQPLISVFLKSADASDRALQVLCRIGICISTTTINNAISSLSKERVRKVGQTLLVAPAYHNINILFKVATPTHERNSTSVNMTTDTEVMLESARKEDLEVCQKLWIVNPDDLDATGPIQNKTDYDSL
jgi:hypothetical protein